MSHNNEVCPDRVEMDGDALDKLDKKRGRIRGSVVWKGDKSQRPWADLGGFVMRRITDGKEVIQVPFWRLRGLDEVGW